MAIEDDTIEQHPYKRKKPNLPIQVADLLPEMITEILSRLPVKSLLQFRSVSKSWRSIISDPKFIKTHLNICSKNNENSHLKLIFSSIHHGKAIKSCYLSPALNGFSVNTMDLDYPMKHPDRSVWIVGSINGLICIANGENDMFLWNPATRISKKLPDSGIELRLGSFIVNGFGYDESTDDYKVVEICYTFLSEYMFESEVMVYSSRSDFWRRIGDFSSGIPLNGPGKFVNGAIHWAAIRNTGSSLSYSWLIVSLDLANETYGEVAQPSYGEDEFDLSLGVLGECLCVLSFFHGHRTDVWMMKEYGVRESWIKMTTIPYRIEISKYEHPVPLYLSKNGEILLEYGSLIVIYDPQSKSFKKSDICNFDICLEANTYLESLVSPFTQEGLERQQ